MVTKDTKDNWKATIAKWSTKKGNWWKIVLIIFAIGFVVTGFKCNFGKLSVEKESLHLKGGSNESIN